MNSDIERKKIMRSGDVLYIYIYINTKATMYIVYFAVENLLGSKCKPDNYILQSYMHLNQADMEKWHIPVHVSNWFVSKLWNRQK